MLKQYHIAENLLNYELPADMQDLVTTIISGIMALLSLLRIFLLAFGKSRPGLRAPP